MYVNKCQQALDLAIAILTALGIPPNDKTEGPCSPDEGIVFLGILIRTSDCSLTVAPDHQKYAEAKVSDILHKKEATVKQLQSLAGILSWISQVYTPGRPRRGALFRAVSSLERSHARTTSVRGELAQTLRWWQHTLRGRPISSSFFWDRQPYMPLIRSDASGEDGWAACAMQFHVVGVWPEAWKQSSGPGAPGMLFKELVPVVVITMLLAPWCSKDTVFAAALDNAGADFVINSLTSNCAWSNTLLRAFVDTLSFNRIGVVADHVYREYNTHADTMSHPIPDVHWCSLVQRASVHKSHRLEIHFVVHDLNTNDCFAATMSFAPPTTLGVNGV